MAALEWKPPPGFNGGAGSGMLAQEGLTAEMRRKQIKNLREMQIQGKRRALAASYHEAALVIQRHWRGPRGARRDPLDVGAESDLPASNRRISARAARTAPRALLNQFSFYFFANHQMKFVFLIH